MRDWTKRPSASGQNNNNNLSKTVYLKLRERRFYLRKSQGKGLSRTESDKVVSC